MNSRKRSKRKILRGPEAKWVYVQPDEIIEAKRAVKDTQAKYTFRTKVDPLTGEPSQQPDAITRRAYMGRQPVDPVTGKPSQEPNAITRNQFENRRLVDPKTGLPSQEKNAIPRTSFMGRRKVDPKTGELSDKPDAITFSSFVGRKSRVGAKASKATVHSTTVPTAPAEDSHQPTGECLVFVQPNYAEYILPPHADAPPSDSTLPAEPELLPTHSTGLQVWSMFAHNGQYAAEVDQNVINLFLELQADSEVSPPICSSQPI